MATSGSILGNPVIRREDPGILVGATQYFDDLEIDGLLHVVFVRSTIAHARIEMLEVDEAREMPGVVAVYVSGDLELPDHHGFAMLPPTMNRPPLARERVRFVGDIVAMVVARSKSQALDAAEAVIVEYDPLPAVADMEAALEADAPDHPRGARVERRERDGDRARRRHLRRRRRRRFAADGEPAARGGADGAATASSPCRATRRAG